MRINKYYGFTVGEFGYWLRYRRNIENITQQELASMSSVSEQEIADIETGKLKPDLERMEKLLNALGEEFRFAVKKR